MSVLLGLDVGTGGARAVAVDESGEVAAEASAEYPLMSPRPGWTEQDPEDWWRASKEALGRVAAEIGEVGGEVVGLGLTGQMHGSVFLDPADGVIRPALLWNDQRTGAQCEKITERNARFGPDARRLCCGPAHELLRRAGRGLRRSGALPPRRKLRSPPRHRPRTRLA